MLTETAIPKGKLTVNDKLLRDLIRSRVKLNQIELRVFRRDVLPILRDVESELVQVLGSFDPDDVATKQRERELLREVRAMIENATGKIPPALEGAITDAAKREVRLVRSSMVKAVPEFEAVLGRGIPVEQLAQITQRTTKTLLEPFAATWGEDSLARVKRQLGASVSLGEDMREAARRVQSVIPATRSQALGIARTGIQRAANLAHDAYREQPETRELVKGVQAVATLDARTCVVCAGLDGKWWSYKRDPTADGLYSERPRYPIHPSDRCVLVDVLKSGDEIGLPGLDFDKGTRASMDGQVPEGLTFPDWLKSQPVGVQKSVLGPARWELWKSGQADFSDFSVAHRARTLAELGEVL